MISLFSLFRRSLRNKQQARLARRSRSKASHRRALGVEGLEDRRMLSTLPYLDVTKPSDSANEYLRLRQCASDRGACGMTLPPACASVAADYRYLRLAVLVTLPPACASVANLLLTTAAATAEFDDTAAIDGCFAEASDLLDATSAATGDGSFNSDGTIRIAVSRAQVGNPNPGDVLTEADGGVAGESNVGERTDTVDTIVARRDSAVRQLDGPPETVPIELVALSLVSAEPIIVDGRDGSTTQWSISVGLSPEPQPQGTMTVTRTHENGGTFQSTLPVSPKFTFQRLAHDPPGGSNLVDYFDLFPGFRGGVSVTAGDVNGDGQADISSSNDLRFSPVLRDRSSDIGRIRMAEQRETEPEPPEPPDTQLQLPLVEEELIESEVPCSTPPGIPDVGGSFETFVYFEEDVRVITRRTVDSTGRPVVEIDQPESEPTIPASHTYEYAEDIH